MLTRDQDENESISGLFDPTTGKVGCVILQAVGGDRRAAQLFPVEEWFLAPTPGTMRVTASLKEWRQVAALTVDERIQCMQHMRLP